MAAKHAVLSLSSLAARWLRGPSSGRRIIYARGFIQRHTVEINMDKIESVDVDQSIMGRAFNYGDVTIRGTGQTFEPLRQIDRPIEFRNEVTAR